jgi:hypothetical protein
MAADRPVGIIRNINGRKLPSVYEFSHDFSLPAQLAGHILTVRACGLRQPRHKSKRQRQLFLPARQIRPTAKEAAANAAASFILHILFAEHFCQKTVTQASVADRESVDAAELHDSRCDTGSGKNNVSALRVETGYRAALLYRL